MIEYLLYIIITFLLGFFFTNLLIQKKIHLLAIVGLSALVGQGIVYILVMTQLLIFGKIYLWFFFTTTILLFIIQIKELKNVFNYFLSIRIKRFEYIYLSIILIQVCLILATSIWRPIFIIDDLNHFIGHTSFIFHHDFDESFYRFGSLHLDRVTLSTRGYPFFLVANQLLYLKMLGRVDIIMGKLPTVSMLIFFLPLLYSFFIQRCSRLLSLWAVSLVLTVPFILRISVDTVAEVPMAILLGSLSIVLITHKLKTKSDFTLLGIFIGSLFALKAEGAYSSAVIVLIYFLLFRRNIKFRFINILCLLTPVILAVAPWKIALYINHVESTRWMNLLPLDKFFKMLFTSYFWENLYFQIESIIMPSKLFGLTGLLFFISTFLFLYKNKRSKESLFLILSIITVSGIYIAGCYLTQMPQESIRLLGHITILIYILFIIQFLHLINSENLRLN